MLLIPKLVTTAWLAAHLADPHLVILHVGAPETYARHIPGAVRTDLSQLATNAGPTFDTTALLVEMLPPDVLRSRLESYGVDDQSTVVVYFANDQARTLTSATRTVFTLRVAGLGAHVALLDGGLPAWSAEHRPLTDAVPQPKPGHITATPVSSLVVDAAWVQSHLGRHGFPVIDARNHAFYDGTDRSEARSGHIPTAASLPYEELYDSASKLKPTAALRSRFQLAGVAPGDTVVVYCHIGMRATAVIFAADQLGFPVKLYDGSFQEWARRPDLPVDDPQAKSR